MQIRNQNGTFSGQVYAIGSLKLVKFQKEIKISLQNSKTQSGRQKKYERRLENDFFFIE